MSKIAVQIIENNIEAAKKLQQSLERYNYQVTSITSNLRDALGFFYSQQPDIVISTVFLQGVPDGITFANKINTNQNTRKPLIFLTSTSDKAIFEAAKKTNPFNYFLKPYNQLELHYTIELAIEKFDQEIGVFSSKKSSHIIVNDSFYIKKKDLLVKVPMNNIIYTEVTGKYLNIYTIEDHFLVQLSLQELLHKLPDKQFIRVRRNTVINVNKILSINTIEKQVILENGKSILISRRNKERIMKVFDVLK